VNASSVFALAWLLATPAPRSAADLKPGDTLPDCGKIPLLSITSEYRPHPSFVASLERHLLSDGVAIVHFCSPRPSRTGAFETSFVEELSALQKAAQAVSYRCNPVAVVPFGEKARGDAETLLEASEKKPWGNTEIYYEPTFPRPGLYHTFRPASADPSGKNVATPWTYLIGPGRKILAVRGPEEPGDLYSWLQRNLPETVVPAPKSPTSGLSIPPRDPKTWPTFRRSPQRQPDAPSLPNLLPYTYLAWKAAIGRTFASPVVANDVVYAISESRGLQSLALDSGRPLQAFPTGPSWWSSPVVAGDLVYGISSQGTVYAVDRASFRQQWKRELQGLVTSSPIVSDGSLFVGSRNGAVYALDAKTGDLLWKFQTGGEISSSPALSNGALVIGSGDRSLYALDSKTGAMRWAVPTGGPVDSSPTIADGDAFVGSFDGALYSVKMDSGAVNWKCPLAGWVHASPAVSGDTVFVGTVNVQRDQTPAFVWIDRRTGKVKGAFDMPDAVYSSPTVWGSLVLVGCRDNQLYAFDREMRQTQPLWTYRTRSHVHASPVVVGDTVLVASYDGSLYALRQSKPIQVWTDADVVPRWFIAALARQLHRETSDLVARAASAKVGDELSLTSFDRLYRDIKAAAARPEAAPKILPRDVPGDHPGAPFIEYVLTAGLLNGQPDGTFGPNDPSTRYQFSSGLSNTLQALLRPEFAWRVLSGRGATNVQVELRVKPPAGRSLQLPGDVPQGHWAFESLRFLAERGMLPVEGEGAFGGRKIVTLKDAAGQWQLLAETVRVVRVK